MGIKTLKVGEIEEFSMMKRQAAINGSDYRIGGTGPAGVGISKFHKDKSPSSVPRAQMTQTASAAYFAANQKYCLCTIRKGNQEFGYFELSLGKGIIHAIIQPGCVTYEEISSEFQPVDLSVLSFCLYLTWIMTSENPDIMAIGGVNSGVCGELQVRYRNYKNSRVAVKDPALLELSDIVRFGLGNNDLRVCESDTLSFQKILAQTLRESTVLLGKDTLPPTNQTVLSVLASGKSTRQPVMEKNDIFTMPLDLFMEKCKDGHFCIPYKWTEEQKTCVPPLSYLDGYVPTEEFRELIISVYLQLKEKINAIQKKLPYQSVMGDNALNIKVVGRPGSGKTAIIEAVVSALGIPKATVNCKERMEEDEIEGINKIVDGKITSIETDICKIHSTGGAIVLEEVNLPDPGILQGTLGQALVFPYILKKDGYIEQKRHPLTVYFATMNVGTNGTNALNEAFSSRFSEGLELDMVSKDAFINILKMKGNKEEDCRKIYDIFRAILNCLSKSHEEIALAITMRHCIKALKLMQIGFPLRKAVEKTFLTEIAAVDGNAAKRVKDAIKLML